MKKQLVELLIESKIPFCYELENALQLIYEQKFVRTDTKFIYSNYFAFPCDETLKIAKAEHFDLAFAVDAQRYSWGKDEFVLHGGKLGKFAWLAPGSAIGAKAQLDFRSKMEIDAKVVNNRPCKHEPSSFRLTRVGNEITMHWLESLVCNVGDVPGLQQTKLLYGFGEDDFCIFHAKEQSADGLKYLSNCQDDQAMMVQFSWNATVYDDNDTAIEIEESRVYRKVVVDVGEIAIDTAGPIVALALPALVVAALAVVGYRWIYIHKIEEYAPNKEFDPLLGPNADSMLPFQNRQKKDKTKKKRRNKTN